MRISFLLHNGAVQLQILHIHALLFSRQRSDTWWKKQRNFYIIYSYWYIIHIDFYLFLLNTYTLISQFEIIIIIQSCHLKWFHLFSNYSAKLQVNFLVHIMTIINKNKTKSKATRIIWNSDTVKNSNSTMHFGVHFTTWLSYLLVSKARFPPSAN